MSTSEWSAGNPKTFPIDEEKIMRMHNQTRWSSTLLISFLSFFFMHPYLIELICGPDMIMMLNHFCVFLYPNTQNFTRHKFLVLSFYLFFKENEINFNIPNFCPPVYLEWPQWPSWLRLASMIATIFSLNGGLLTTHFCIHNWYFVSIYLVK